MVQWLRLYTANAGVAALIPGWGTKILHAVQHGQKIIHTHTHRSISMGRWIGVTNFSMKSFSSVFIRLNHRFTFLFLSNLLLEPILLI